MRTRGSRTPASRSEVTLAEPSSTNRNSKSVKVCPIMLRIASGRKAVSLKTDIRTVTKGGEGMRFVSPAKGQDTRQSSKTEDACSRWIQCQEESLPADASGNKPAA